MRATQNTADIRLTRTSPQAPRASLLFRGLFYMVSQQYHYILVANPTVVQACKNSLFLLIQSLEQVLSSTQQRNNKRNTCRNCSFSAQLKKINE